MASQTVRLLNSGETTADQVRQLRLENKIVPVQRWWILEWLEFDSETPYFYSTYGWENESIKSDKEPVLES